MTSSALVTLLLLPTQAFALRVPAPRLCAGTLRGLKAKVIKERLQKAGVVIPPGIVEKEELVRLLEQVNERSHHSLPITMLGGGTYAMVDAYETGRPPMNLLIDTGAAVSLCSSEVGSMLGQQQQQQRVELRSRTAAPGLVIPCAVAPPAYSFPPGVDGILGFDVLSSFATSEINWRTNELRLHEQPLEEAGAAMAGAAGAAELPFSVRQVSAGRLPFVRAVFGTAPPCDALLDSGSPVTMITPELCDLAGVSMLVEPPDADIISTGVDGQPTRMRATLCERALLGSEAALGGQVERARVRVFTGTCSMMQQVGWAGTPAALIGLDLLACRGASDGSPSGRLVLDNERKLLRVEP